MEELTIITEGKVYEPGMSNPGEEVIRYFTTIDEAERTIGEPIDWYIGEKPPYRYAPEDVCFYCGAPRFSYKVTRLTDGTFIGYPMCKIHTGGEIT